MRKTLSIFGLVSVLTIALLAGSSLYAAESNQSSGADMDSGMMGGDMMGNGAMGNGDMMGMMKMMQQMSQMMESCDKMMESGGSGRPNEQWRKDAPAKPEQKG